MAFRDFRETDPMQHTGKTCSSRQGRFLIFTLQKNMFASSKLRCKSAENKAACYPLNNGQSSVALYAARFVQQEIQLRDWLELGVEFLHTLFSRITMQDT